MRGNPPFKGARKQSSEQKADLAHVFGGGNAYKDCD
ncbi:MAG: DNA methyltransferase [Halofilum sp. (in: g-proteobacteria)]|nr:DNA methyltransferase [Halofilum sp. (in: g-proteobacteria)]